VADNWMSPKACGVDGASPSGKATGRASGPS
jgi:hypothetical protein